GQRMETDKRMGQRMETDKRMGQRMETDKRMARPVIRLSGLIRCCLAVILLGCASPPVAGQLLSERSRVFFRPTGQAAQEVTQGEMRRAMVGDELWTQSQGRALLKFADLWLRLYDDTTLRADDVTPASIKLALGQGATLVGKAPAAAERVEVVAGDPPAARIVLAGTLLMVAQPERRGATIVRLFGGVAAVINLRTDQAERISAPGWAVVDPDGGIYRPDDDEMRQVARDLDRWDVFAEIERDAVGFGPTDARPDGITLVFQPEQPAACAAPPALELTGPKADGLTAWLDGRAVPGCPDDPIGKLDIAWGDGAVATELPAQHTYNRPGTYTILVRAVSARGQQVEARRSVMVRSPAVPLPNLVGEIVKAPQKAACGQQLGDSVAVQVSNIGAADAGGFYLALYLSEDEQITTQDLRLSAPWPDPRTPILRTSPPGSQTYVEGLAAGKSQGVVMRGTNQIPTTLPEGTRAYWLGVIVDETATVAESSEGDNAGPPWRIVIGCLK
ncbi:MAG: CARDB domain-containing protein, partial [Anaerolineae bacterium]